MLKDNGHRWPKSETARHFGLRDIPEGIVLVPVRDPRAVARSWVSRGEDVLRMFDCMNAMMSFARPVHYLPIDRPDRDTWLQAFARAIGVVLSTDWRMVGTVGGDSPHEVDVSSVMPWYSERFGYG